MEFSRRLSESIQEIESNYEFVHEIYKTQKSTEDYIKLISLTRYGSEHLVTQNSTFLEMVSAGRIGIISNDSLKATINELYRDYEIKGKHIQEFNEYTVGLLQEQFKILLGAGAKYRSNDLFDEPYMYDKSDWEYINDPKSEEFKISVATAGVYSSKHRIFVKYFEELIKKTSKVRAMIRKELNMDKGRSAN